MCKISKICSHQRCERKTGHCALGVVYKLKIAGGYTDLVHFFSQFAMMKMMLTAPEQKLGVRKDSKSRNKTQGTLYTHIS